MTLTVLLVVAAFLLWPRCARGVGPAARGGTWDVVGAPAAAPLSGWMAHLRGVPAQLRGLGRRTADATGWVADFAEVVSTGLDAGLTLDGACELAARTPSVETAAPWVDERLRVARERGAGVALALDPGHPAVGRPAVPPQGTEAADLLVLVTAWRLSEELGTPAAAVTATAARSVRERRAARDRLDVATSGPRASMALLSTLPMLGPVGAAVVGVGPTRLYASTAGAVALALGAALTLLGWWWARVLLRAATRPAGTGATNAAERIAEAAS